jgi:hypothetical protein
MERAVGSICAVFAIAFLSCSAVAEPAVTWPIPKRFMVPPKRASTEPLIIIWRLGNGPSLTGWRPTLADQRGLVLAAHARHPLGPAPRGRRLMMSARLDATWVTWHVLLGACVGSSAEEKPR